MSEAVESGACPCGSERSYDACCEPLIRGARSAALPEELMRSRYSAYVKGEIDHLVASTEPSQRRDLDREVMKIWSEKAVWRGFTLHSTDRGGERDDVGVVEFTAHYEDEGTPREHHEHAVFTRVDGAWYFDPQRTAGPRLEKAGPDVGRNEPCPCGSGKKYKKCCGAA